MTKPAAPQPSAHLAAGAGLLARKAAQAIPEIIKQAPPIALEGVARTITLLPVLLLDPVNGNADLAKDYDNLLAARNYQQQQAIPLPPQSDEVRLAELEHALAAQTLTAQEEAELIILLAKVKGIRIQQLSDLMVEGPLRGSEVGLPEFHNISLSYTKRDKAALKALRAKFDSTERERFLRYLGTNPTKIAQLKKAGFTDEAIDYLTKGIQPGDYQVHHKLPLDDGGDNSFDNLLLIKNDPYHLAITNVQRAATKKMAIGETRVIKWPMFNGSVYPNKFN